jgi:hypothetical protein
MAVQGLLCILPFSLHSLIGPDHYKNEKKFTAFLGRNVTTFLISLDGKRG